MLSATLLGIFIIPVAFYVVEKIAARFSRKPAGHSGGGRALQK